jgi:TRAP-type C4-dicarboxylate transport system permease small subunit
VSAGTTTPTEFANPLQIDTLPGLLNSILVSLRGVIVVIAVIFIVIGGIMYMTSAGNETMVTRAKQTWTGAVVGLAIALAAPAFLNEILSILEAGPDVGGTGSAVTIKSIAINTLNFLLSIFGVLAIISLVIGGGMYLTAYGDEKKIDSGKKIVTYAIIGIVVALSALVVVRQIANLVGVTP